MAFSESSHTNSLVSFLDTASRTINGLMEKPNKGNKRKVNLKNYLKKRLQQQAPAAKATKVTKSKSAPLKPRQQPPARTTEPARAPAAAPFLHHNSWPQLPCPLPQQQQQSAAVEPDLDYLLRQLTSTPADLPPQPPPSRPCSESALYPMTTFSHHQTLPPPPPTSTLETQVLIGEQPYGSPYTPSNCSTDDLFEDSLYSSPSSSVYSSPTGSVAVSNIPAPLTHTWNPPVTAVSTCVPTSSPYDWDSCLGVTVQAPTPCMVSSDWCLSSSPALLASCPVTMDQSSTVPQLWDPLVFDHMPY